MERDDKKRGGFWGYAAFCFVLLLVLLYLRFPAGLISHHLEKVIERSCPQCVFSAGDCSLSPRVGIRLRNVLLKERSARGAILFEAERLVARPVLASIFKKGLSIAFECDTYGGSLNGSVFIAEKRTDSPLTVNAEIDGLKMEEWEAGRLLLGRRIDGSLSGRLEVNQVSGSFMNGTGTASFHVSGGKVQLLQQGSGLDELRFEDLLLKMGLDNGRIDLERAEVSGGDVKGSLSGTITINRRSIIRSPVNLTGSAEILDVLISRSGAAGESLRFFKRQMKKGRLSFVIRGTIQSPSLRFR